MTTKPASNHQNLSRNLENVLEEAELSGILDLSGRNLREFPSVAVGKKYDLTDTTAADLSDNRLTTVPNEIYNFGCSLEHLKIGNNGLNCVSENIVTLQCLTHLDLSCNRLKSIPGGVCRLPLQTLLVSQNALTALPKEIGLLSETLMELDVSCNQLSHIPPTLGFLHRLRILSVRENALTDMPYDCLSQLELESLDLSSNHISRIPCDEFRYMPTLIRLNLTGNPILAPPMKVVAKGPVHVFKWLETEAYRRKSGGGKEWSAFGTFNSPLAHQRTNSLARSYIGPLNECIKTGTEDHEKDIHLPRPQQLTRNMNTLNSTTSSSSSSKRSRRFRGSRYNTIVGVDSGYCGSLFNSRKDEKMTEISDKRNSSHLQESVVQFAVQQQSSASAIADETTKTVGLNGCASAQNLLLPGADNKSRQRSNSPFGALMDTLFRSQSNNNDVPPPVHYQSLNHLPTLREESNKSVQFFFDNNDVKGDRRRGTSTTSSGRARVTVPLRPPRKNAAVNVHDDKGINDVDECSFFDEVMAALSAKQRKDAREIQQQQQQPTVLMKPTGNPMCKTKEQVTCEETKENRASCDGGGGETGEEEVKMIGKSGGEDSGKASSNSSDDTTNEEEEEEEEEDEEGGGTPTPRVTPDHRYFAYYNHHRRPPPSTSTNDHKALRPKSRFSYPTLMTSASSGSSPHSSASLQTYSSSSTAAADENEKERRKLMLDNKRSSITSTYPRLSLAVQQQPSDKSPKAILDVENHRNETVDSDDLTTESSAMTKVKHVETTTTSAGLLNSAANQLLLPTKQQRQQQQKRFQSSECYPRITGYSSSSSAYNPLFATVQSDNSKMIANEYNRDAGTPNTTIKKSARGHIKQQDDLSDSKNGDKSPSHLVPPNSCQNNCCTSGGNNQQKIIFVPNAYRKNPRQKQPGSCCPDDHDVGRGNALPPDISITETDNQTDVENEAEQDGKTDTDESNNFEIGSGCSEEEEEEEDLYPLSQDTTISINLQENPSIQAVSGELRTTTSATIVEKPDNGPKTKTITSIQKQQQQQQQHRSATVPVQRCQIQEINSPVERIRIPLGKTTDKNTTSKRQLSSIRSSTGEPASFTPTPTPTPTKKSSSVKISSLARINRLMKLSPVVESGAANNKDNLLAVHGNCKRKSDNDNENNESPGEKEKHCNSRSIIIGTNSDTNGNHPPPSANNSTTTTATNRTTELKDENANLIILITGDVGVKGLTNSSPSTPPMSSSSSKSSISVKSETQITTERSNDFIRGGSTATQMVAAVSSDVIKSTTMNEVESDTSMTSSTQTIVLSPAALASAEGERVKKNSTTSGTTVVRRTPVPPSPNPPQKSRSGAKTRPRPTTSTTVSVAPANKTVQTSTKKHPLSFDSNNKLVRAPRRSLPVAGGNNGSRNESTDQKQPNPILLTSKRLKPSTSTSKTFNQTNSATSPAAAPRIPSNRKKTTPTDKFRLDITTKSSSSNRFSSGKQQQAISPASSSKSTASSTTSSTASSSTTSAATNSNLQVQQEQRSSVNSRFTSPRSSSSSANTGADVSPPIRKSDSNSSNGNIEVMLKGFEYYMGLKLSSSTTTTTTTTGSGQLGHRLSDGVNLCNLFNKIRIRSITTVHSPTSSIPVLSETKRKRNAENFLGACRRIGIPDAQLCSGDDILTGKNVANVAKTVAALLRTTGAMKQLGLSGVNHMKKPSAVQTRIIHA